MKIIELRAERFKRISAVEIVPGDGVVVISGKNAQGKSSVLDAIWLALGGGNAAKDSATSRPVKDGEKDAIVRLDLGEIIVTRKWTSEGGTSLTVEGSKGAKFSSPQTLLDSLVGNLSFDPLAFSRMSPREQRKALSDVVQIDVNPDAIDLEKKELYDERTDVNRDIKRLEARLAAMTPPKEGVPQEEVSLSVLLEEMNEATKIASKQERERQDFNYLRTKIRSLEAEYDETARSLANLESRLLEIRVQGREQSEIIQAQVPPNIDGISERIKSIEDTNASVRAVKEHRELYAQVKSKRKESEALTYRMEQLEQQKVEAFEKAKFPVPGLAFDADGVTYRGIPFQQCSTAEQTRIAIAIAASLNPEIRVIRVSDGSLLDSDSMAEIESLAKEHDMQIWIERVDETGNVGIVIEDGAVKERVASGV